MQILERLSMADSDTDSDCMYRLDERNVRPANRIITVIDHKCVIKRCGGEGPINLAAQRGVQYTPREQ